MSKNQQRIRSGVQLGYEDGLSGKYGRAGRYTQLHWRMRWDYRRGYRRGLRDRKYGKPVKKSKKPFVMRQGAVIALDIIAGSTLTILIAYVIGLFK